MADVLAGQMTATDAHARFLAINEADPKTTTFVRIQFPGRTDAERAARQVVLFIRESGHPRAAEVASKVGRELLAADDPPGGSPRPESE